MTIQTRLVTADELLAMPDDGMRLELVRGEVRRMPPAGDEHGELALDLAYYLKKYVMEHDLGKVYAAETGFRISSNPDTVRAPDVAFISRSRLTPRHPGFRATVPDLVAEVNSPNDRPSEVAEKVEDWLRAGVRMVIVVEPRKRTVTVYRSLAEIAVLTEDGVLDGGDVVPGWILPVRDLFA